MNVQGTALVIGGTSGIGEAMARRLNAAGMQVIVAGRDADRATTAAARIGPGVRSVALDLAEPQTVAPALAQVERVDHVIFCAMERDGNHVRRYDAARALRTVGIKMVGSVEVLHALQDRLSTQGSVLLMGGAAFLRPTAGSVTTAAIGSAMTGLARSLCVQLAPVRVNAIHPGVVDGTHLRDRMDDGLADQVLARTPTGRLVTVDQVVDLGIALMGNGGVNGADIVIDGGWTCM